MLRLELLSRNRDGRGSTKWCPLVVESGFWQNDGAFVGIPRVLTCCISIDNKASGRGSAFCFRTNTLLSDSARFLEMFDTC